MRLPVVALMITAALPLGCKSQPKVVDRSELANNGVNIVPKEVLAASRSTPTTLPATTDDQPDLVQTIQDSQQKHYVAIEVLQRAGMIRPLQFTGNYTVLVPTDDAFAKLPPGRLDWLLLPENHGRLVQFAEYHLIRGRISEGQLLQTNGNVSSYVGLPLTIRGVDGKVIINDANVIKSTNTASNGNVMWIDNILDPDLAERP